MSCVFAGCSTTAYYSAQTDPQITLDKQEPLTIYTKETPSITEKKFALLLAETMIENGFKINGFNYESKKTNCYITFSMDTSSSQHTGSYTTYHTSTTYIPGTYGGNSYNPGRTITTTTPTTNVYTTTIVKRYAGVSIFCKDNQNKKTQVWFGFTSANVADYDKYQYSVVKNLVDLIGHDFDGYLDIDKKYSNNLKNER